MEITVKIADTPELREECYRLAYEIFCGEMGTMRAEADHDRRILRDSAIETATVLHAEVEGECAGTMGILQGTSTGHFPEFFEQGFEIARFLPVVPRQEMAIAIRFLVKEKFRSSMLPFRLIVEAAHYYAESGVKLAFCDCQPHLLNLYKSLGFRPYAPVFEQPGFGVMVPLVFLYRDIEHLRAIRSPLLRYIGPSAESPEIVSRLRALLPEAPPVASPEDSEGISWGETYAVLSKSGGRTRAFEGFSEEDLRAFLDRSQIIECTLGQQVIVEGQGTRTALVVLEGEVEVRHQGEPLARFGEGEIFGEFAFLLHTKRTADVFATTNRVRVLLLDERTMQRLLTSQAALAAKFLLNLSKSLASRLLSRAG